MSQKIGFWPVFALVTASQIGSGVLNMATNLAPYGYFSLLGWLVASLGAIALALVFATLCTWYPKTGGPHVYVHQAFGPAAAFFTGWTYWIISWVSTTVVVVSCIGYLIPLIGIQKPITYCALQIVLLCAVLCLNLYGVKATGFVELLLSSIKYLLIFIMPLIALCFFDSANIILDPSVAQLDLIPIISRTALLILWGFIGLESATASAGSIENPEKTIPKAVILGTLTVALLYLLNIIGIMGLIPGTLLLSSQAPYAQAAQYLFSGNWHLIISLMASIGLIGTLNAWVLTSGQISLGLAQDGFFPQFFSYKNKCDAPLWGLLINCLGMIPLLFLTMNENLTKQILDIIDYSTTAFLFVYLICCLSFLTLLMRQKTTHYRLCYWLFGLIATIFCCWILSTTAIGIPALFIISGLPLYYFWYRHQ